MWSNDSILAIKILAIIAMIILDQHFFFKNKEDPDLHEIKEES